MEEKFSEKLLRMYGGPVWHGASTTELLEGVDARTATVRPPNGYHNIAELVRHMITWREFAIQMIHRNYDYKIEIGGPVDWPVVDTLTDDEWAALKQSLVTNTNTLAELFDTLTEEHLNEQAGDRPFSLRVIIDGVIDHDVYHGGQIAYLKRIAISE